MAHGETMKTLASKSIEPSKNWEKILKSDMKLDKKEAKKSKLKDMVKNCK